jgi:hypothetical protein
VHRSSVRPRERYPINIVMNSCGYRCMNGVKLDANGNLFQNAAEFITALKLYCIAR